MVSRYFTSMPYRLNEATGLIDYDKLEEQVHSPIHQGNSMEELFTPSSIHDYHHYHPQTHTHTPTHPPTHSHTHKLEEQVRSTLMTESFVTLLETRPTPHPCPHPRILFSAPLPTGPFTIARGAGAWLCLLFHHE
jgi:hypothetical protein